MTQPANDSPDQGRDVLANALAESETIDAGRDALAAVVKGAFLSEALDAPVQSSELAALKQVAVRHKGLELTLEPVAVELVAAVLKARFGSILEGVDSSFALSRSVARVIFEDPAANGRLQRLWNRLGAV